MSSSAAEHSTSGFLEGLTKEEVTSILTAATLRHYMANSVITNQADPAERFFLLKTGCARLFFITQDGRKVLLRWLSPGELLGGAALLARPSAYIVGTEIIKKSSAFVWHRNTIRDLATRYPRLLENALPFALEHLTWFVAAHMALISSTARERLAQVLLSLVPGMGRQLPGGIQLDVTNEQLANAANITPFTTSRILGEWKRTGVVEKGRGTVTVCNPSQLFSDQF